MEKYQKIYDQFYNSDENFKSAFEDVNQFAEYVGDDDSVVEELKQVYNFSEEMSQPTAVNPAEPIKKKDDSSSELSSDLNSIDPVSLELENQNRVEQESQEQIDQQFAPSNQDGEPKKTSWWKRGRNNKNVFVFPEEDPMGTLGNTVSEFEKFYQAGKDLETPSTYARTVAALVTLGLSETEIGKWIDYILTYDPAKLQTEESPVEKFLAANNDKLYSLEKPMIQIFRKHLTGGLLVEDQDETTYLSPRLIKSSTVYQDKEGNLIEIEKYNEDFIELLSKPNETFLKGLDEKDIVYNRVPNLEEIDKFVAVAWENIRRNANSYPGVEELKSWEEVYDTKIGEIFKQTVVSEVKQGIESIGINKEVDKEFLKTFGGTLDSLEETVKEKAKQINIDNRKIASIKAKEITDGITNDYLAEVDPIIEGVKQIQKEFEDRYSGYFNDETQKYEFQTQEQIDDFQNGVSQIEEIIADANVEINQYKKNYKKLFDEKLIALDAQTKKDIDEETKSLVDFNFSTDQINGAYERGIQNYYSNKKQEENLAKGKLTYGDIALSIVEKSSLDLMGGFSSIAEMYGFGSGRFSTYLRDLGTMSEEIDADFLNPSVVKTNILGGDESPEEFLERISTIDGLKQFGKDAILVMVKQAPTMLPAVAVGFATKNSKLAAAIAMASDTAVQMNEIHNRVIRETGSLVKATEAARKQYGNQLALSATYSMEMDIILNKMRINGFRDMGRVALIKSGLETSNEFLFQETVQDYLTEKTTFELMHPGSTYNKPFLDHYNFKTFADVAVGSGGMATGGTIYSGSFQISREKTKNSFLAELEQKGLASLVLDVNKKMGSNGALGLGSLLRLQGKLDAKQYKKFKTTIKRLNEFNEVNEAKGISDERSIAAADKMLEKQELLEQKEKAETQEKKDLIDGQIKELDTKISDLQDVNKEVELAVVKDIKTGRVIYATDNESMNNLLKKNMKLAGSLFSGIFQGVFNFDSKDSELNNFIKEASSFMGKMQTFMQGKEKLREQYNKKLNDEKVKRSKNKKNTLTDAEIEQEYKTELQNLVDQNSIGIDVSNESLLGSQSQRNATNPVNQQAKSQPIEFNYPAGMENKTSFEASETETLDAFIEANKNNANISVILEDIKTQYETFKSLFPNGKMIFHSSKESFTQAYNKYAEEKSNELMNDNGMFIETEDGEIHINMPETTGNLNEYVVAHELTHGILLKAFGKKVYNDQGQFLRWEKDQQAIDDMQFIIEKIASEEFGPSINSFFDTRSYEGAETAEEFVAQLGALMSRAQSPLEMTFVGKVLAAISRFVKSKTGKDIFANYRKQVDALEFFNYIASQINQGQKIDESNFEKLRSGFMIPKGLDAQALAEGNIETGTNVGLSKATDNINSVLGQFTERPGTNKLALDLPVKTLEQAIREHEGAVLLIMSDNTGFFVKDDTGEFVMGGYGYMAAKDNIDAGIGFASVNLGTVRTTMTNAMACRDGKPVLVLVSLSAPKAALGNFYAQQYTFGSLSNIAQTPKQSEEIQNSIYNALVDKTPLLKAFSKNSKLLKSIKDIENKYKSPKTDSKEQREIKKMLKEQEMKPLMPLLQAEFDKNFASILRSVDFTNKKSVDSFVNTLVGSSFSFPARQGIIDTILPTSEDLQTNKNTPLIKKILLENGLNQIDFHNTYGEPYFVGDQLDKKGNEVTAPWGIVYGGFTLNPSVDFMEVQSKGLTHPQFNAKVPGSNHFLLPTGYSVNENFYEALQFGDTRTSIAQMASQGIQPGTRLPASNKDPNALTAEERRAMLLDRQMTPAIRKSVAENMQVMESFAEQFSKRLNIPYEFYHNENEDVLWYRTASGKIMFNTANATVNTPIFAYSGAFLEIIKNDNIVLYTELVKGLLQDKNSEFYKDLQNNLTKEVRQFLKSTFPAGTTNEAIEQMVQMHTIEAIVKNSDFLSSGLQNEFHLNNTRFNKILENVLLDHFGRIASEEYDLKSGIYKALEKIWDEIVKMIKETFAFNKIQAEKIVFPSKDLKEQMMTPLQYLAKQFADPRNEFLRDTDFEKNKPQPVDLSLVKSFANAVQSSSSSFNQEVFKIMEGPSTFYTNIPIDLVYAIKDDQLGDSYLNDVVNHNIMDYEEVRKLNSFKFGNEEFSSLERFAVEKYDVDVTDQFLDDILSAFDKNFARELENKIPAFVNFRTALKITMGLDKVRMQNSKKAKEILEKNGSPENMENARKAAKAAVPVFQETKTSELLDRFAEIPDSQFLNVFNMTDLNANVLIRHIRKTTESNWNIAGYIESYSFIDYLKEFTDEINPATINFLNQILKISDFENKVLDWNFGLDSNVFEFERLDLPEDFQNVFNEEISKSAQTFAKGKLEDFVSKLNAPPKDLNRYQAGTTYQERNRRGEFTITHPSGRLITMEVSTVLSNNDVNISFKEKNSNYGEMLEWGTQIQYLFTQIINKVFSLYQNQDIASVTFQPVWDAKEQRKNIYNIFARKKLAPYHITSSQEKTTIYLPKLKELTATEDFVYPLFHQVKKDDVSSIESTYKVRKSRAETLGKQSREIDADYEAMVANGMTNEQIFGNLFSKYSFEALRSSKYNANFQSAYDMYVSEKAKEAWQGYSDSWNTRKDGIINFIDKYILENSLMDLVTLLRKGVRFITVDGKLLPEGENQSVVDPNLATPYEPVGTEVKFNDLEIYSALFEYGIPQHNLDAIFGTNYRKTIENLLLDDDFDEEIKQNLSEDARSSKIPMTFSQLKEISDQLGVMNSTAILNYINKHLSVEKGSPVMAAIQTLVDKIKDGENVTDAIAGELGTQIETVGNENIQALAEIGTAAGRILRILRELNNNKGDVIVEMLRDFNIKVTPAFEAEIKARAKALDNARAEFEKAKKNAINDFSDETIGRLKDAESALEQAEFDFAMITTDPRLQFRFLSDVLSNRSSLALLSFQTVVLSAVSNVETLLAKFGVNTGLVKRLVDRGIPSKIGLRAFPRKNKQEYRNRRLAFSETKSKSWDQMIESFLYGQVPGTAQTKFFENMARVNSVRDVINLANLVSKVFKSFSSKNPDFTDLDFADTMQAMLIEHQKTGKLMLADNKAYTVVGALLRSLMQGSELTGRLMAFGMDKFTSNIVAKKSLLDYLTVVSQMENENLPKGLVNELKNKNAFQDQEVELKNMAILLEAIFRDERNNPFEREGQRSVFFADNLFTSKFLGEPRKAIRKAMINTYMNSLEGKAEDNFAKQFMWGSANAAVQALNVAQWTYFIFAKVPSNILMQILLRSNPVGATLNTIYMAFKHNQAKNDFYKKYNIGKEVPETDEIVTPSSQQSPLLPSQQTLPSGGSQAVTTTSKALETTEEVDLDSPTTKEQIRKAKKKMNSAQKIQFEKDLANLFDQRRRLVTAAADIPRSYAFMTTMGLIAGSGAIAISSGDDPDKKKLFRELGIKDNDLNVSYATEFLKEKAFNWNLTPEEFFKKRGGYNINRNINPEDLPEGYTKKDGKIFDKYGKEVETDFYMNITNFGTYTGYTLGYLAAVYAKQNRLSGAENDKTEGFKEFFDMGSVLTSVTGAVFRQTPSVKTLQLSLEKLDPKNDNQNKQSVLPNLIASTAAFTSPSLTGKPRSAGLAETSQFAGEIEPSRENINIGSDFLEAHMNLSRNGVLGLGIAQSEFYKSEIGLFGENLAYRRTVSEPGNLLAYLESTINFPSFRKGTGLETSMAADERIKHQKVRSFLIDNSYLAQVYANNGGDANMYWKIFDRPRRNTFVLTESEDNVLTKANFDKPFKLPNDIYRDELRILGEYMMGAMDEVKEGGAGIKVEDVKALVRNAKTQEEENGYIEEYFQKLNERFAKAEADYKKDFLADRAGRIIRTMKDRNLLTESDMVVLEKVSPVTDIKNILESEVQPKWEPVYKEKPNRSYFDSKK